MQLTIDQALQKAIEAHRIGKLREAEHLYRAILRVQPKHPDANHNLGLLAVSLGKLEEAQRYGLLGDVVTQLTLKTKEPTQQHIQPKKDRKQTQNSLPQQKKSIKGGKLNRAEFKKKGPTPQQIQGFAAAFASRNLALAEQLAKTLIQKFPNHATGWKALGATLKLAGKNDASLEPMQQSVRLAPNDAEAHYNLGVTLKDLGFLAESATSYREAIRLKPGYAKAYCNLGVTLKNLNQLAEAEASYREAIRSAPNFAEAHGNLGNILQELGRLTEAEASYREAIRLKPDYTKIHGNLGIILRDLGRLTEAEASYREAIRLNPNLAELHSNLGNALKNLGRLTEAAASYREAIRLNPDIAEVHGNLGNLLMSVKQYDRALESSKKAYALAPDLDYILGQKLHCQMMLCDWENFRSELNLLNSGIEQAKKVSNPFPVLGLVDDLETELKAAKIYVDAKYPASQQVTNFSRPRPDQKIRIGYYSADFHNHATAYLMAELFDTHDSNRFEVHGFSFGPNKNDQMRHRLENAFDRFHEVSKKSDSEIAQMSRELGIDIAIDLKGYTAQSRTRIFAERAAPIQVNYLGYPGTMGAPYIDYIIADKTVIPEKFQAFYTEKVVYLPNSYQVNDSKRQISDKPFTRHDMGLPDDGFVFCCFNNNYKILPETFDGWMRILKAVAGSVLWLYEGHKTTATNLREAAKARGVDPDRLVFAKGMDLDEHLARHRLADLFIDTFPYNAHTTASDALWAGLPVLTFCGHSFASRVAASLLNAVGMPELITERRDEYEALAIELATTPEKLAAIKAKLQNHLSSTPLFDGQLFAKHIEAAYLEMYHRFRSGLPPDHLSINPDHATFQSVRG